MTASIDAPGDRLVYGAVNRAVLDVVPTGARRILDVGCGDGSLGSALKARQPAEVVGLTYSTDEADLAAGRLDRVEVCDLNALASSGLGTFDCVVCSHVLERLCRPEQFLAPPPGDRSGWPASVVALPNVAWRQLAFHGRTVPVHRQGPGPDPLRFFD